MHTRISTACIFRQNDGDSMVTVRLQSHGDGTVTERLQHGLCMVPARSLHGPCMVWSKCGDGPCTVIARSQYGAVTVRYLFGPGTVIDRSTWSWSGTCSVLVWSVIGVSLVPVRWRHFARLLLGKSRMVTAWSGMWLVTAWSRSRPCLDRLVVCLVALHRQGVWR